MKQQADPTPKTQKEILQQNFDDAEALYREAAETVSNFSAHVDAERKAIEKLEGDYNSACRTVASGGSADTASICAEKDRRGDRVRGLEILLKEATERLQPLEAAQAAAARALQNEINRLEREQLEGALVDAKQERTKAQSALDSAHQAVSKASYYLDQFDRKIEIAKKHEQLRLQGRM